MLTSILIGLDGSAYSDVAVELGIQWAKKFNSLLVGLGIVDEPTICQREAVPLGGASYKRERDEQLLADGRRKVEDFLERFGVQCAARGVAYQEVEDVGLPYEEILRESHRYDLVLLGHETHFHFETSDRADETLWHVLRSESRPVVIAPAELHPGKSVVVAYNESPQADRALQAFQTSGLDFDEEVHIICVDADEGKAAREAERAVEFLRPHGIPPWRLAGSRQGRSRRRSSTRAGAAPGPFAGHGSLRAFEAARGLVGLRGQDRLARQHGPCTLVRLTHPRPDGNRLTRSRKRWRESVRYDVKDLVLWYSTASLPKQNLVKLFRGRQTCGGTALSRSGGIMPVGGRKTTRQRTGTHARSRRTGARRRGCRADAPRRKR